MKYEEWIADNDQFLINEDYKPTFVRENDISSRLSEFVLSWDVQDEESVRDHTFVVFMFHLLTKNLLDPRATMGKGEYGKLQPTHR